MTRKSQLTKGRALAGMALLFGMIGCGGSGYGQVEGKITFKGQPLAGMAVMFVPERGPAAAGLIADDGTYHLITKRPGDGALVGRCKVAIVSPDENKPLPIAKKYINPETSGLTAEVKEGNNVVNFDIPEP
jgi:hypothetical protein